MEAQQPMTWFPPTHIDDILLDEGVIAIVGTGRSGKTALAHLLAAHSYKPVYALDYPVDFVNQYCPEGWNTVSTKDVFSLSECVILMDDAALFASARQFGSSWSKAWVRFQTIISHKKITLITVVQSLNLLDIGVLRSQRMAVLYKYSSLVNCMYEREEFRDIALQSRLIIDKHRNALPSHHHKSFVFDHTLGTCWNHPLPEHWDENLSTPYADFIVEVQ